MPKDPIVNVDRSKKIPVYTVRKVLTDEETTACKGKFLNDSHFAVVLKESADVYTEDGKLLARFRKGVLPTQALENAYNGLKEFMKKTTTDRGAASGSEKGLGTGEKTPVMSNILGYFDKWSISQKSTFKHSGIRTPGPCRLCTFNVKYPEKWKRVEPLIREISKCYEELCPDNFASQRKAARSTPFHIKGTAFSTVTTNLNFRTAAHTDSGDWSDGFGNLVVIEHGSSYKGAYTGFPQYGVGVDCRMGDFLAMDVHQLHGNSEMIPSDATSQRLSLVSYLREGIIRKCGNQQMYDAHKLEKRLNTWRSANSKTRKIKRT